MGKASEITAFAEKIPGNNKYDKFIHMLNFGYDEKQIRKELNISSDNYFTYLIKLEHTVDSYLGYLANTGYVAAMLKTLQGMGKDITVLENTRALAIKSLQKTPDDSKIIYNVIHASVCLHKMRRETFELQGDSPLVAAYRQFIKKNIVEKDRSKGDNSNNRYNLPVLPRDIT